MKAQFFGALALAVLIAGCGGSGSPPAHVNASAELEALISHQLPRKLRRLVGPDAFITGVRCVREGGSSYQCVASVSGSNAYSGAYERTQLPISATCDERACIWRVSS